MRKEMKTRGEGSPLGTLLAEVVDCVSHRGGETLRIMAEAKVTLQQVLLLTRLRRKGSSSVSDLAGALNLSLSAISQAIDRLISAGMVSRIEDPTDRRRKRLATTKKANNFLDELNKTRANEYGAGLSGLSAEAQQELAAVLKAILSQVKAKANPDGESTCRI